MTIENESLSREEEEVRARLEVILGVLVKQLDFRKGTSIADLKIVRPDGDVPVEVTRAVDSGDVRAIQDKGFQGWSSPTLAHSRRLGTMGPAPHFKSLRKTAHQHLRKLEEAGVESFEASDLDGLRGRAAYTGDLPERERLVERALGGLAAHGGQRGYVNPTTTKESTISFVLGRSGSRGSSGDPVAAWVTDFVNDEERKDNVTKLDRGGAEAHLAGRRGPQRSGLCRPWRHQ